MSKELVVADTTGPSNLASSDRPVIVFNGLSDDQFNKALALFQPPPRTKPTLWERPAFRDNIIKAAAFCEAAMYNRPNGNLFASQSIANHFDGMMIERFHNDNDDFKFSINEEFNDARGPIPDKLKHWDPKGVDPMPSVSTDVDWADWLTEMDLRYAGFLDMLCTCIDFDERITAEVTKYKHSASTSFGEHAGTTMPDPIHAKATFEEFTASRLIGGGGSSGGLRFGPGKLSSQ